MTGRLLACASAASAALATAAAGSGDPIPADPLVPAPPPVTIVPQEPVGSLEVAVLRRRVRAEHRRYVAARRRVRQLTRTLSHRSSTREAIQLACATFGNCQTLWSLARCESGYSPTARNPSGASGLFQFLPGTWSTTPFASMSVWSPYANAMAGGWMLAQGRRSEWVC